jgi:nucleoid DNA-binding protein
MKKIADKLGFNYGDFFKDENQLVKEYFGKAGVAFSAENEKKRMAEIYSELAKKVDMIDGTLSASVQSELQKAMKGIDAVSAKVNRALKQKEETQINRIGSFKQKLQPEGIPQERHENFSTFYLRHGEVFMKELKDKVNPLLMKHLLLVED